MTLRYARNGCNRESADRQVSYHGQCANVLMVMHLVCLNSSVVGYPRYGAIQCDLGEDSSWERGGGVFLQFN